MEVVKAISPYFIICPLVIGLIQFKTLSIERKYLLAIVFIGGVTEICMRVAAKLWHNNMPLVHLYTLLEFCFLLTVFYRGKPGLIPKNVYMILLGSFSVLAIGNVVFYQGFLQGNSLVRTTESIILICIALYYFYNLLQQLDSLHPERTFLFWVSVALLIYFGGNLLIFIYFNKIQIIGSQSRRAKELMLQIGLINYLLNIFLYTLYSVALLCKNSKPSHRSLPLAP